MDIVAQIGTPVDPVANNEKIFNTGRISYSIFKVSVGVLFGISVVMVITRTITRLTNRHRIYLDDILLLFGFICLSATTGLLYYLGYRLWYVEAAEMDPTVFLSMADLLNSADSASYIFASIELSWACIFFVKASFLALFRLLIRRLSRSIVIYYWFVVGFSLLTWILLMCGPFIECHHFERKNFTCKTGPPFTQAASIPIISTILDVCTDIMIVSIPILVLRKSQMKPAQKISLGIFLCLSCVMVVASIIRVGGLNLDGHLDITWEIYWIWAEGCVAVIMGSAVAFRALFIQDHRKIPDEGKAAPFPSMRQRFQRKWKRSNESTLEEGEPTGLPQIPSATLTGLRSFMWRHNRSAGATTVLDSEYDTLCEPTTGEGPREIQIYRSVEWDIRSDHLNEDRPLRPFPFTVPVERELGLARGF